MGNKLERDIFDMPIRKKGINSKQKGNKNELDCAKALTLWTGAVFHRTPSSGGLHWANSQGTAADLVCEDVTFYFPFSSETKHLKVLDNTTILKIWKQATADAIRGKKLPMALLRQNGQRKFNHEGDEVINYTVIFDVKYGGALLNLYCKSIFTVHSNKRNQTLIAFMFSDIIKSVKYQKLAKAIENTQLVQKFLNENEKTDS